jgi:quinol monooxygenase YgiN
MPESKPVTVICTYKVKPGKGPAFEDVLRNHWPTLLKAGLVTSTPPRMYRGLPSAKPGGRHGAENVYVEIYEWKDEAAVALAHQSPQVMAVWEPLGTLCDDMDFPHFEPLSLVDA